MFAPILHGSHTSGWPAFLYLRNHVHASGMLCGPPPVGNPSVPLNATIDRIDCPAPAPSESEATSSSGRVMPDSSLDFRSPCSCPVPPTVSMSSRPLGLTSVGLNAKTMAESTSCLLYTSDAADEED